MRKYFSAFVFFFSLNCFAQQSVSLNGIWKISVNPVAEFWKNEISPSAWNDIKVPGECLLQGIKIEQDKEFVYKKQILIPANFKDKLIRIRFDGVYSYARVWINGKFVRDHFGGFTTWYCDITKFVKAGESAWITVGVTDKKDDISRQSDYAHHLIGGILRKVTLESIPKDHLAFFHIETDLDDKQLTGMLKINARMNFSKKKKATVILRLVNMYGNEVKINPGTLEINSSKPDIAETILIKKPDTWTAEMPGLYTLSADVWSDDEFLYSTSRKIGFRKVEYSGNELRINHMPVKLRGACRHDVHPLYGRSTTDELDEKDVRLMKEANVNFVRTSHYPPSEHFLDLCDKYGIYVEEENAICFMHNHPDQKPMNTNDEPYVSRAVTQMGEMIEKDRDHPSVIIWSIGNESIYGTMFKKLYDFTKATDKTRPVIFSYPYTAQKNGVKCYDIYSMHYADYKGYIGGDQDSWQPFSKTFGNDTMPELNDEFAHLACYNKFTLRSDPGVRDFWGESIDKFWSTMYDDTTGCLGGSIWAWADDIFYLPDTAVGYGPWGPVDGWRRPKPEYWHLKKAYSPVKILNQTLGKSGLTLEIQNRFDHITLARVTIKFRTMGQDYSFRLPNTLPHKKTKYLLPRDVGGDFVYIAFYLDSLLLDANNILLKMPSINIPVYNAEDLKITKTAGTTKAGNSYFMVEFDNKTGKIISALGRNDTLIKGGPYLNFGYCNYEQGWESQTPKNIKPIVDESRWVMDKFECVKKGKDIVATVEGHYDTIKVSYTITIGTDGKLKTHYTLNTIPKNSSVIGWRYLVPSSVDSVIWKRRGYRSIYPYDHIGRLSGSARKLYPLNEKYRNEPSCNWKEENIDYFLNGMHRQDSIFGTASRDYLSRKMDVYEYSIRFSHSSDQLSVIPESDVSAKMDVMKNGSNFLCVDNFWRYPDLEWGNYEGPELPVKFEGENTLVLHPLKK